MARIKLRRDTEANWIAANPVLDLGEPGYVTDTEQLKIGNGVDDWNALPYFFGGFDGGTITNPLEITASGATFGSSLLLTGDIDRNPVDSGLLRVGPVLGFTDINIISSFVDNVDDYTQVLVQNRSAGSSASADFVVNNDVSGANYGNFGINSSGFTAAGPFDQPNGTYLLAAGGELAVGTVNPYNYLVATNSTTRMEVLNNGTVEFKPSAKVEIQNTTDSTAFNTGALVIAGGLAVGRTIVANDNLYLGVGAVDVPLTDPVIVVKQSGPGFIQSALINANDNGSADFVAYTDSSTEGEGFADMGFCGATFNDPAYTITSPGDGYIFVQGLDDPSSSGSLVLATGNYGYEKDIVFATGGFLSTNERMHLSHADQQLHILMTTASTNTNTGAVRIDGGVGIDGNLNVGGNVNKVEITPPATVATLTLGSGITLNHPQSLAFPAVAGTSGSVLTTNGAGTLSWTTQANIAVTKMPIYHAYGINYAATLADNVITVDPNGVARTITLPVSAPQGKIYTIKKVTSFAGPTVTVDTDNVFCTIDGAPSYALNNMESVTVVMGNDGVNDVYYVIGKVV